MNRNLVRNLLLYIVDQLQDMEAQVSTIRLVKLLYLIDLEYFIRHKKTLTEINWVFYHYGPYFYELGDILNSASIDLDAKEVMTQSGKGYTYRVIDEQDISKLLDFVTEQQINRIIKKWALEDTRLLLDFVYNTPPIKMGQRGNSIDFSLAVEKEISKQEPKLPILYPMAYRLMLASESILAKEWDTPEEDEAWAYLSKKAK
jgi:uncharacterized phage-associated protein